MKCGRQAKNGARAMGRGLSPLQRSILKLALEQEVYVCANNVLAVFYGSKPYTRKWEKTILGPYYGWRKFEELCESERAATCRAFKRLEQRGLLMRWTRGYRQLTPEGEKQARKLMVNNPSY